MKFSYLILFILTAFSLMFSACSDSSKKDDKANAEAAQSATEAKQKFSIVGNPNAGSSGKKKKKTSEDKINAQIKGLEDSLADDGRSARYQEMKALSREQKDATPLGQIKINISDVASMNKCLKEWGEEIKQLAPADQYLVQEVTKRMLVEILNDYVSTYGEAQFNPSTAEGRRAMQLNMQGVIMQNLMRFNGGNIFDVIEYSNEKSIGKPPADKELQDFFAKVNAKKKPTN